MNEYLIIIFLLLALITVAIAIIWQRNYLFTTATMSLFSLLSAGLYVVLYAPDVALTEAAIGVCISTVIILSFVTKLNEFSNETTVKLIPFLGCLLFLFILYGLSQSIPEFGISSTPANNSEILSYYNDHTKVDINMGSLVAAILASFRGFDTFGETMVIYTALLCVMLIFSNKKYIVRDEK